MSIDEKMRATQEKQARCGTLERHKERRAAKNRWSMAFLLVNCFAIAGLLVFMLVFHRAQPEYETFFDRFYQLSLRTYWDKMYIRYLVYIAGIGLAATMTGLGVAMFRGRRRTDHRTSIIVLCCLYGLLSIMSWLLLL